jgi:hypothetical protein
VKRTCNQVFDAFLRHCDMRVASKDMAYSTSNSYRKILNRNWRPQLGEREFESALYRKCGNPHLGAPDDQTVPGRS